MTTFKKAIGFCLFISLYGCDLPGIITIENISQGDVVYRYEIINNGDSTKVHTIEIPKDQELNKVSIMFGFGTLWTDKKIREYIETINSIEVISPTDSIYLTNKEQIYEFYRTRRKGIFKNEIKIRID